MTSSGEIIALEGAGAGADPLVFKTNFKPKKPLKHRPYFMDPAIVPRVKQVCAVFPWPDGPAPLPVLSHIG